MDANTTKKTFSVAIVALLVGSLLVSGFAAAHVEGDSTTRITDSGLDDPGASTNAVLHYDADDLYDCDDDEDVEEFDCDGNPDSDFYVDIPSSGEILFEGTYDLFFVGIPADAGNGLSEGDEVTIYMENVGVDGDDVAFGDDGIDGEFTDEFEVESETLDIDADEDHCIAVGGQHNSDGECVEVQDDADGLTVLDGTTADTEAECEDDIGGVWDGDSCDFDETSCEAEDIGGTWDGDSCENVPLDDELVCEDPAFDVEGTWDDSEEFCYVDDIFVFAVAFEEISFITGAGTFWLAGPGTDDSDLIGTFFVNETSEIDLELDPNPTTYVFEEPNEYDAIATWDGEGVSDITLSSTGDDDGTDVELLLEVNEDLTSSSGRAVIDFDDVDEIPAPAGFWTIVANADVTICGEDTLCEDEDEEDTDDSTIAEETDITGEAVLEIASNTLFVEEDSTDVLAGFRQSASWMVQYPEEDEDETDDACDGEEGLNVVFPGEEVEGTVDDEDDGCVNGLLYFREFEVANVSIISPNGDVYWLNQTFAAWTAEADEPLLFCVDADEDDEEDECAVGGDDAFDSPLLVTIEDDGTVVLTPNEDFEHPLEDDVGPLSEDNRVWLSGVYNITVDVSTSGRGTNGDGSSYELTGTDFADWDDDFGEDFFEWLVDAADYPEYTTSWEFTIGDAADVNMELAIIEEGTVDDDADTCDDATQDDSVDVQNLAEPLPIQTFCITVYGSTIDDHPLCAADVWEEDDEDTIADESDPDVSCPDFELNDELEEDETLEDAQEDFVDSVDVDGDLLPGWEVVSYDAISGLLVITGVTPTQAGNITVTVEHDGETFTLTVPVENGAKIALDVDEITVGSETDVTATIHDQFGGLVTTADLTLVNVDGAGVDSFGSDFDVSPSSGEISGSGAAGRGLGGEYTYAINPDTNTDLVIFAIVGEGGADEAYAYALVNVNPAHDLNADLDSAASAMASVTTPVVMNVSAGWDDEDEEFDVEEVSVWFIHEDGWEDFGEDGAEALEDLAEDEDEEQGAEAYEMTDLEFRGDMVFFNATLRPGNYSILVCDTDCTSPDSNHDNADDMPTFAVSMFTATFTPARVANDEDIEENVRVAVRVVDSAGRGASGILRSIDPETDIDAWEDLTEGEFDAGDITAVITNGFGNFTGVTGTEVGQVAFTFDPSGSSAEPSESLVNGVFNVVGPDVTVTPSSVRIGQVTLVTIQVRDFDGDGLPGREINLCIPGEDDFPTDEDEIEELEDAEFELDDVEEIDDVCPLTATTGADGSSALALNPVSTNPIRVYVNGSYTGFDIPVLIGTLTLTLNPSAPDVGDTVTATATLSGTTTGSNAGINIRVTRDGTQVLNQLTTAAGTVTISNVQAGNYTVVASRTGFGNATARFTVGAAPACALELENLNVPASVNVGTLVSVSATVSNDCDEELEETAILLVNNNEQGRREVTVGAGNQTNLAFNFTPTVAGSYTVVIRLGDTNVTRTITVGLPTTPTPVTPTGGTPVTPTGTTPVTPTGTTPTTSPTTSTPTTTSPTPSVPGFEVAALIAALGVALLVLRRRS